MTPQDTTINSNKEWKSVDSIPSELTTGIRDKGTFQGDVSIPSNAVEILIMGSYMGQQHIFMLNDYAEFSFNRYATNYSKAGVGMINRSANICNISITVTSTDNTLTCQVDYIYYR